MFYLIGKEGVGSSSRMRVMSESDYRMCVMDLSKILSDDGKFIISEDENYFYLKGVK
tara:strand:+ start:366 stop:536 length:171 start_codon:yes stop_codon:yes gene_type:complete